MQLPRLCFPAFTPRLQRRGSLVSIYDPVRRLYVRLTPEEWVRQSVLNYLVQHLAYPLGLMAVEQLVRLNGMPQRADIIAYGRDASPYLLVECKAPSVPLSLDTLEQAARYNSVMQATYYAITNGQACHVVCSVSRQPVLCQDLFPSYPSL